MNLLSGAPCGVGQEWGFPYLWSGCHSRTAHSPAASSGSPSLVNPCALTPQHLGKKRGPRYWLLNARPPSCVASQDFERPRAKGANTGAEGGRHLGSGAGRRDGEGLIRKKIGVRVRGLTSKTQEPRWGERMRGGLDATVSPFENDHLPPPPIPVPRRTHQLVL